MRWLDNVLEHLHRRLAGLDGWMADFLAPLVLYHRPLRWQGAPRQAATWLAIAGASRPTALGVSRLDYLLRKLDATHQGWSQAGTVAEDFWRHEAADLRWIGWGPTPAMALQDLVARHGRSAIGPGLVRP